MPVFKQVFTRLGTLVLVGGLMLTGPLQAKPESPQPNAPKSEAKPAPAQADAISSLEEMLDCGKDDAGKAKSADPTVAGNYKGLLKTLRMPKDCMAYTRFNDYGWWEGSEYKGFRELPQGYWVYVYPNWYVYETSKADS